MAPAGAWPRWSACPRWTRPSPCRSATVTSAGERRRLGKQLAAEKYDQPSFSPTSMKSALIPWFAQIPVRTGWKGEHRFGLLNDMRSNKKAFPLMEGLSGAGLSQGADEELGRYSQ